jgi:hypothetical protein
MKKNDDTFGDVSLSIQDVYVMTMSYSCMHLMCGTGHMATFHSILYVCMMLIPAHLLSWYASNHMFDIEIDILRVYIHD